MIPFRCTEPLNGVEFQRALAERASDLRVESLSGTTTKGYAQWVAPYLFYFVAQPRAWTTGAPASDAALMLVPLGSSGPRVFQRRFPQAPFRATHSLAAFYAPPADGRGF